VFVPNELIWAIPVVLGALMAFVDRLVMVSWYFAFLLLAGLLGGILRVFVGPFRYSGMGFSLILGGGSALALIGYVFALLGLQTGK
jgi:hypothetical protein